MRRWERFVDTTLCYYDTIVSTIVRERAEKERKRAERAERQQREAAAERRTYDWMLRHDAEFMDEDRREGGYERAALATFLGHFDDALGIDDAYMAVDVD